MDGPPRLLAEGLAEAHQVRALFWTAVINGFLTPPLLVVIMLIANNRKVMGYRVNGLLGQLGRLATTAVMFAAPLGLVLTWVT